MTPGGIQRVLFSPSLGAERAQSDPLVEFHVIPNMSGFADNHSRSVVNEHSTTDGRRRMNIDACPAMRVLTDDARNERYPCQAKLMGHPVGSDRLQGWITEHDFFNAACRRVESEGRHGVFIEHFAQGGQASKKTHCRSVGKL